MYSAQRVSQEQNVLRLCAASPSVMPGDVAYNKNSIIDTIRKADALRADYLVLPEMCLTGVTLGALYAFDTVLQAASEALREICSAVCMTRVMVSVGLPYRICGRVQSCTAILRGDRVYAILPLKQNSAPFGFENSLKTQNAHMLTPVRALQVFGADAVFEGAVISAGEVMLVQSCANATTASLRRTEEALRLCSARTGSAIAYASPNMGESGTNFVFDGYCAIAAGGEILALDAMGEDNLVYADIDTASLCAFEPFLTPTRQSSYLPEDESLSQKDCLRILELQAIALARRAGHIGSKGFVIGVSGGLDSALALLAAMKAAERMGIAKKCVLGISMPGFGSSKRTRNNARLLVEALGASYREIDITESCRLHFRAIEQDEAVHDVVFENAQARERTQILLDISNKEGLLDVGTGDLSEAALGWTTFGGDHLAQYGINASIPKTVIRKVVAAAKELFSDASEILQDILDTPVSPELLPGKNDETIAQKTEELIGSYELHDFFIFEMLVNKKGPRALFEAACKKLPFSKEEVYRVLGIFIKRFFAQQYKRCCAPEAPDILLSLSPRLFPFPSDMRAGAFIEEYERIKL